MQTSAGNRSSSRREFLKKSAIGAAVATAATTGVLSAAGKSETKKTPLHFPPLPYPANALEPYISEKTMTIHHDKHHRRFMEEVITRVKGTDYQNATLEKIIKETYGGITMIETLHIMAILSWNHGFFWKSMKPKGGGEPPKGLKEKVVAAFGSVNAFKKKFKEAAMTLGSGWAWLVQDKGKLAVNYTNYHKTPLLQKQIPLLTLDCWEHAYYLDYQNEKGKYVDAYLNHCLNWDFAAENLAAAEKKTTK